MCQENRSRSYRKRFIQQVGEGGGRQARRCVQFAIKQDHPRASKEKRLTEKALDSDGELGLAGLDCWKLECGILS